MAEAAAAVAVAAQLVLLVLVFWHGIGQAALAETAASKTETRERIIFMRTSRPVHGLAPAAVVAARQT